LTYIKTGLEPDGSFEQRARDEAARKGWRFEKVPGSLKLFEQLLSGDWTDQDFLVVQPGWPVVASYDDNILTAERIPDDRTREDSRSH
jgi:hypothetical protein